MTESLQAQRTRTMIQSSMVTLLQIKDFHQITIQDIATEALINRQTFYNYYQDKYDLIEQMTATNIAFIKNVITSRLQSIQDHIPLHSFLTTVSPAITTTLHQHRATILALWDISYNQFSLQRQLEAFFLEIISQSNLDIRSDYTRNTLSHLFSINFKEVLVRNALPTAAEVKELRDLVALLLH